MHRIFGSILLTLALCTLGACDKSGGETTPPEGGDAAHHAKGHEDHHAEGEEHDHGDVEGKEVVAAGEATVGDVTACPVSGEKFVVTEDSPSLEHEGKTYYFCCANCQAKAQADPGKYLMSQASEPAAAESTEEPAE
jgi:Cu+-exporting ATPase